MQHPIGVEVVNTIKDLVHQAFHHVGVDNRVRLARLWGAMEADDVPEIMLRVIKEEPHFSVTVVEKNPVESYDVGVFKFTKKLKSWINW